MKKRETEETQETLPAYREQVRVLGKEKEKAEQAEANRAIIEKYGRVLEKKKLLDRAQKSLNSKQKLTSEHLSEINNAFMEIDRLRTELTAGKLVINFDAKKQIIMSVVKDIDQPYEDKVEIGEKRTYEAGGRLILESHDWNLSVISGEGDFANTANRHEDSKKEIDRLLKSHSVNTIEEAREIHRRFEECERALEYANTNFADELGGITFNDLKKNVGELCELQSLRPLNDVTIDFINAKHLLEQKESMIVNIQEDLRELEDRYKDRDSLFSEITDTSQEKRDKEERLSSLTPLPEGYESADMFIQHYNELSGKMSREADTLRTLELEHARIQLPDQSSEELQTQLNEAKDHFGTNIRKGKAIARVRDTSTALLKSLETHTFDSLQEDLEKYIATLTDKRYEQIIMEDGLPAGFLQDGNTILQNLLSTGTIDALMLALRLSMSNYFLKNRSGFIAMDDPLVNMDPDRQSKAASLLRQYAKEKQVLIFTCHPSHADLLEGAIINLS
ncbi:hypothetical protein HQ531_01135 [bacterium]|nr:hypothetical protein [bacterium]